jgi:hypothetical protein
MVTGGAVAGQNNGEYPIVRADEANAGGGAVIPTTAVEQYGSLFDSHVREEVFPNFGNFGSNPHLGLMGQGFLQFSLGLAAG